MRGRVVVVLGGALVAVAALALLRTTAPPAGAAGETATVLVAASFAPVVGDLDPAGRHGAAGSDRLALQVRGGARADLFISADTALAATLHREGLLSTPVHVGRNRLVVIVARGAAGRVQTVADLARPGVRVVLAAHAVPAGGYARAALEALGLHSAVRGNVVSEEPDVTSVAAKVALGAADAGVVYATDARAVAGRVVVRPVPAAAQPPIAYAAGVPTAAAHPARGRALLARLRGPDGRAALERRGFAAVGP